ncbi:MAG TPA: Hsp20/alpha crystallin family protein [Bacteroidales bacterium]|nr:Hsp20/alpha crystallin family protein [Bacteroidales bacterium]
MTLVKTTNGLYPTFHSMLDDFWGTNWLPMRERVNSTVPAVNIHEDENGYKIEVAAPGYEKSDFSVTIENEMLTIAVEKKEEKQEEKGQVTRKEFAYSSFTRRFNIPQELVDAEKVEAHYDKGILTLTIPKREEVKPKPARMIEIH